MVLVPSNSAINADEEVFLTCCCWPDSSFASSATASFSTLGMAVRARRLSGVISGLLTDGSAGGDSRARSGNGTGAGDSLPSFSSSFRCAFALPSTAAAGAAAGVSGCCLLVAGERIALKMSSTSPSGSASLVYASGSAGGEASLVRLTAGKVDLRRKLNIVSDAAAAQETYLSKGRGREAGRSEAA